MSRSVAVAITALALALPGCGTRGDLQPPPGQSLPVAPYGRLDRPTAEELLTRPAQAAPERTVELRRRSEEREDDPFDLPPDEMRVRPGSAEPAAEPNRPVRECPDVARQGSAAQVASCQRNPAAAG